MTDLTEKTLATERKYTGKIISVDLLNIELPDGRKAKRGVIRHGNAVGINVRLFFCMTSDPQIHDCATNPNHRAAVYTIGHFPFSPNITLISSDKRKPQTILLVKMRWKVSDSTHRQVYICLRNLRNFLRNLGRHLADFNICPSFNVGHFRSHSLAVNRKRRHGHALADKPIGDLDSRLPYIIPRPIFRLNPHRHCLVTFVRLRLCLKNLPDWIVVPQCPKAFWCWDFHFRRICWQNNVSCRQRFNSQVVWCIRHKPPSRFWDIPSFFFACNYMRPIFAWRSWNPIFGTGQQCGANVQNQCQIVFCFHLFCSFLLCSVYHLARLIRQPLAFQNLNFRGRTRKNRRGQHNGIIK